MAKKIHEKSLANLIPAKPGEVRNPLGINRKRIWSERYVEHAEELLSLTAEGRAIAKMLKLDPEKTTFADAAVRRLMREALKGNVAAFKEMADRTEGKAPQRIEISTAPKTEVTVRIIHELKKPGTSSTS